MLLLYTHQMIDIDPDLSAGHLWLARRTPAQRKRTGQWATPYWLCRTTVDMIAPQLQGIERPTIVDPACGDGRWLVAAARRFPGARLVGLDIDRGAIEAARATLKAEGIEAELRVGDALEDGALPPADAVIGNPPFVRPQHLGKNRGRELWSRFSTATDKSDLFVCFVQRALETAPVVAMVVGRVFLSLASFSALRERVLQAGVDGLYALPRDAFGATVDTLLLHCGPQDRRIRGEMNALEGRRATGTVYVGDYAWSLQGPMPQLPGVPLGDHASVHMGIVCGDYPRYVHPGRKYPEDKPTCRGRDVKRWHIGETDLHVRYDPRDMLRRKPYVAPKHAGLFDVPEKVVVAGTTGRKLVAAMDTERRFPMDSCYVVHPRGEADPWGLLGLLLSKPVGDWYGARFGAPRVKGVELKQIPIPPPPWTGIAAAARTGDEEALNAAVERAYARCT